MALRRWLPLLAFILAGAGVGWALDRAAQPRGVTYGSPPAVQNADHALGVYIDLAQLDPPAQDQFFAQLAAAGMHWVRMPLAWQDLEQAASSNNWAAMDRAVDGATARNFRLLA